MEGSLLLALLIENRFGFALERSAADRGWEWRAEDLLRHLIEIQVGIIEGVVAELADDFQLRDREA